MDFPKEHPDIPGNVEKNVERTKSSEFGTFVVLVKDVHASKSICRVTIWNGTRSFFYTPSKNSIASNSKKNTILTCACFLLYIINIPPGNKTTRTNFLLQLTTLPQHCQAEKTIVYNRHNFIYILLYF